MFRVLLCLAAAHSALAAPQGVDDDDNTGKQKATQGLLSAAAVAKAERGQPKGCKDPACPQDPPSPKCGYLASDEKDARGCLRYPCGVLSCAEDAGAHKTTADPGQEPVVTVLGPNPQRISIEQAMFFDDDGALCDDPREGEISENVEEGGDFASFDRPGTYEITYECTNNRGVEAKPKKRVVTVYGNYRFEPGDLVTRASMRIGGYTEGSLTGGKRHDLTAAIADALMIPWQMVMIQNVSNVVGAFPGEQTNEVDVGFSIATADKDASKHAALNLKSSSFALSLKKEMKGHELKVTNFNFSPSTVVTTRVSVFSDIGVMWDQYKPIIIAGLGAMGVCLAMVGGAALRMGMKLNGGNVELANRAEPDRDEYLHISGDAAVADFADTARVVTASSDRWESTGGGAGMAFQTNGMDFGDGGDDETV